MIAAEEARIARDLSQGSTKSRPGLREQYDIQLQRIKNHNEVDAELIICPFYFPSPAGAFYIGVILLYIKANN